MTFAIWPFGWIIYIALNLYPRVKPPMYMNLLGLAMIVYVFFSFEIAKRLDLRETARMKPNAATPTVCPSCHEPLEVKTKVAPFRISYKCVNNECGLDKKS